MSKDPSFILERCYVPKDTMILREGEEGNCAYLIQSGRVRVFTKNDSGKKIELATLGLGQIFGELALIFDEPRSASVESLEDCNLIVLTRETLDYKLGRSDPTIQSIVEMLTQRIITTNNTLLNKRSNLEDLREAVRVMYQNIITSLPRSRQREFQSEILPKLEDLLNSVDAFQKRTQ